jgi:hypothetical protein
MQVGGGDDEGRLATTAATSAIRGDASATERSTPKGSTAAAGRHGGGASYAKAMLARVLIVVLLWGAGPASACQTACALLAPAEVGSAVADVGTTGAYPQHAGMSDDDAAGGEGASAAMPPCHRASGGPSPAASGGPTGPRSDSDDSGDGCCADRSLTTLQPAAPAAVELPTCALVPSLPHAVAVLTAVAGTRSLGHPPDRASRIDHALNLPLII